VWNKDLELMQRLSPDSFEIYEGKQRLPVVAVTQNNGPMTIGVVVDLSASMGLVGDYQGYSDRKKYPSWMPSISNSLRTFVESGDLTTEYFIVTSGDESQLALPHTMDHYVVDSYLRDLAATKTSGRKGMMDGLERAFGEMAIAKHGRKVLIVVSDTIDSDLRSAKREQLRDLSRTTQIPIYVIFAPSMDSGIKPNAQNVALISSFTDEGGIFIRTDSPIMVTKAFEFLAKEFKSHHSIRFRADKSPQAPKWRDLKVTINTASIKPTPGGKVSTRAPKKFYL